MSALKNAVALFVNHGKVGARGNGKFATFRPLLSCAPVAMVTMDRGAHTQDITKNIQYISNDKIKLKADPATMKLDKRVDKPICVMINWLLARQKHVMKYATLYLEQGFDVVSVSCTPWQLMWPMKGSQLVAEDLIKFMAMNENEHPLVVHGFSVAGYMWGEVCVHVMKNKELYMPVMDRVVAQVWDSAADISELAIGVPAAVFPKNQIMQKTLRAYMEYHMKTFHEVATSHYIRSSQLFHTNLCHAPALFLLSRSDPVGAENSNRSVHDSWVKMGVKCTWKCWDRSPHVQHYTKHPKEYVAALYEHLDKYGLVLQPEKMRMRL
uniref:Transmembrane protein 53 n=1 Tax=Heliothis virescens TaxID=7102 RepID=A0A2A4JBY1_HELVI